MKTALSSLPSSSYNQNQTQFYQTRSAETRQADIKFETREGDLVTISQGTSSQAQQTKRTSSDGFEKTLTEQLSSSQFTLAVQGDLNEQELADLSTLLDKLSLIATDFFAGDINNAVSGALNIGEMGTISSLEATFAHTTSQSSFLKGPHPIPDLGNFMNDGLFAAGLSENNKGGQGAIVDTLQAQWKQFLEYFDERSTNEAVLNRPEDKKTERTDHIRQMLTESKNEMSKHPRLTPFIPALANQAIDKSAERHGVTAHGREQANRLKDRFAQEYINWLI